MRLPSPNRLKDPEVREYLTQLVQALERQYSKHPEKPFTVNRIKAYDVTKQYVLSCGSVGITDAGRVLGTLLIDLQESGVLP